MSTVATPTSPESTTQLLNEGKEAREEKDITSSVMLLLITTLCILIAPLYLIYKPPGFIIRYFQRRWPDVLWTVPTKQKCIALTIDDAPSEFTRDILEILKANKATATFFVIGSQMRGREEVLQDLIRDNNELGNHAMEDEPSRSLSDVVLREQIRAVQTKINDIYTSANATEPPRNYFRPGSGFFSKRMRKLMNELGFRLVLGSIYPHDPQIPFWRVNARHILSMLRPGGIIICHDRRSWTAPMLRKVIPEIRRRGYRIVTVTELLKEGQVEKSS